MGIKFVEEDTGKWYEFTIGWKWPHNGFTIGYDYLPPNEDQNPKELYYAFLIHLGLVTIVISWGNTNWTLEDE